MWGSYIVIDMAQIDVGSYIVRDMAQVDVRVLYCQRYGPSRYGGLILSEIWPR